MEGQEAGAGLVIGLRSPVHNQTMTAIKPPPAGARVGFTTTIPVEVVLAAGLTPVDLNNLFIADPGARARVAEAEAAGFPRTICAWIKGIYAALQDHPEIRTVIVACQGDCSYTQALGEILEARGPGRGPLQVPLSPEPGATGPGDSRPDGPPGRRPRAEVARVQARLAPLRRQLRRLDRLTWETGQVTGEENFLFLISSSDFASDLDAYELKVTDFLQEAAAAPGPRTSPVRLGFAGIPPIFTDLWDYLEELGAGVVFHEFPRQFSMPYAGPDLAEQYLHYTYPYDIFGPPGGPGGGGAHPAPGRPGALYPELLLPPDVRPDHPGAPEPVPS